MSRLQTYGNTSTCLSNNWTRSQMPSSSAPLSKSLLTKELLACKPKKKTAQISVETDHFSSHFSPHYSRDKTTLLGQTHTTVDNNLGTKNLYPLVVSTANVMCTARPWWHKSPPTKRSTPCYSRLQHTNPQSSKQPLRVSDCIPTGTTCDNNEIYTHSASSPLLPFLFM